MQSLYELPHSRWDEIKTILEPKQRKRKTDLQLTVSGIIYLLQLVYKARRLLCGNAKIVWYYYHKWTVFGVLEQLLHRLTQKVRIARGRQAEPGLLIIDSQSVKTVAGTSEEKGYDGGKKVTVRKRHLAVDTGRNVMAVGVTAANVHDKPGALSIKEEIEDQAKVKKLLTDGSYRGVPPFTAGGRIEWEVVEKKATGGRFKVLPKRWVVERTFAWLGNYRRLGNDYEKTVVMSKAMIVMSAICITLNKLIT